MLSCTVLQVRSGYDGPWTHGPLKFDNQYYKHLIEFDWKEKRWHGKKMYTDVATERLGMLPTDMALKTDASFRQYAEIYARDQKQFFHDFAWAYAKLISLGCPPQCDPTKTDKPGSGLNQYWPPPTFFVSLLVFCLLTLSLPACSSHLVVYLPQSRRLFASGSMYTVKLRN